MVCPSFDRHVRLVRALAVSMRTLIIVLLILTSWSCQSQPKKTSIPTYNDGDTTLWYG